MSEQEHLECVKAYKILLITLYGMETYKASDELWVVFRSGWMKGREYVGN